MPLLPNKNKMFHHAALAAALLGLLGASSASIASSTEQARAAFEQRQLQLQARGDSQKRSKQLSDVIFAAGFDAAQSSCNVDSDGDRLMDCVETGTGRYVDANDTGTDPNNPDTDGDGLSDGAEVLGTETGLDLQALGANPLRRDLLIEYDWFDSNYDCGPHSQRPTEATLARVAQMFANAPLTNPDGSQGIHLIQDAGQGGLFVGGNRIDGHDAILPGTFDARFRQIKQENFNPARLGYFRYVMLPHRYNGGSSSSGYAELPGDDAIVSLYCLNSESNMARTIAHELGHLLGLHHGGFEPCNQKPNYNSLMNYRFQFGGVDSGCDARSDDVDDFSRGIRLSLNEADIDEHNGVCNAKPIDWNTNGQLEAGLTLNLNPNDGASCGSELRQLEDFNDWENLSFFGLNDWTGALKSIKTTTECAGAPAAGSKH